MAANLGLASGFDPVHDVQLTYRVLLDAMSRPGQIEDLAAVCGRLQAPPELCRPALAIGLTLLDAEVSFTARLSHQPGLEQWLRQRTLSRTTAPAEADYVFLDGKEDEGELAAVMSQVRKGTLISPESSATLLVRVGYAGLKPAGGSIGWRLTGPGIREEALCFMTGISPVILKARTELNREYPCGVDMYLFSETGQLFGLPRTTQVEEVRSWS